MNTIVSIVSKYLLSLIMLLYMIGSFRMLKLDAEDSRLRRLSFIRQAVYVLLFHAVASFVILFHVKDYSFAFVYAGELAFLILYAFLFRKIYPKSSVVILSHTLMFLVIGFVVLYRLNVRKAIYQLIYAAAAGMISLAVPAIFRKLKAAVSLAVFTGIAGLLLLIVVLILSPKTYGANLSITIGPFSFQPSEFVKISFVLLTAFLFRDRQNFGRVILSGVVAFLHIMVLVWSTDLGSALIFAFAYLFMVYTATNKVRCLLAGGVIGVVAAAAAYLIFAHVRTRVQIFLDPWTYFSGRGSQVCNSLLGIADGGLIGTGLYSGSPYLIPVVEKDFIFSAIAEELGGIAAVSVILLCFSCLLKFIQVAGGLYLPFYRLTGIGLAVIYGVQSFLSIGGNIKFIPATGVTLPFVSYGGSSIFSTFILFALMQELFIKRNRENALEKQALS